MLAFWILVVFATVTCLFMAWSLGANSNSPPFAPAIGANAISTMRAAFLIGILAAAGALTQGGAISETVGAELIDGVAITPLAATTGLLVAASFMAFGVYSGYPVPAAFATTGAMVGVGLSLGGDPAFDTYRRIGTFWVMVPPVSGGLAYLTATLLRREDVPDTVGVPLLAGVVAGILANVRLGVIPHPERAQGSIAEWVSRTVGDSSISRVSPGSTRRWSSSPCGSPRSGSDSSDDGRRPPSTTGSARFCWCSAASLPSRAGEARSA